MAQDFAILTLFGMALSACGGGSVALPASTSNVTHPSSSGTGSSKALNTTQSIDVFLNR
jgi:hypothetical protein